MTQTQSANITQGSERKTQRQTNDGKSNRDDCQEAATVKRTTNENKTVSQRRKHHDGKQRNVKTNTATEKLYVTLIANNDGNANAKEEWKG